MRDMCHPELRRRGVGVRDFKRKEYNSQGNKEKSR